MFWNGLGKILKLARPVIRIRKFHHKNVYNKKRSKYNEVAKIIRQKHKQNKQNEQIFSSKKKQSAFSIMLLFSCIFLSHCKSFVYTKKIPKKTTSICAFGNFSVVHIDTSSSPLFFAIIAYSVDMSSGSFGWHLSWMDFLTSVSKSISFFCFKYIEIYKKKWINNYIQQTLALSQ